MVSIDDILGASRAWARDGYPNHAFVQGETFPYCATCGGTRAGIQHVLDGVL